MILILPTAPDADSVARRSLKNLCLSYLMSLETEESLQLAKAQYEKADNMTDMQVALVLVAHSSFRSDAGRALLVDFYERWKSGKLSG